MKPFRILAAGLAMAGICAHAAATSARAQSGLFAGINTAGQAEQSSLVRAQFRLPFGMSATRVREMLARDGYNEIDVTYLGIIDAKAEACRNGRRYKIKLRANGSYEDRTEIGKCRKAVAADEVDDILRREGFRQVDVQDDGRLPYAATGCRRGDRYDIRVSEYGDVTVGKRRGRCETLKDALSPRDLRRALRKDGYNRIKFTERSPRRFTVEACNNRDRRMRLTINRRGRVLDRERVGRCQPAVRVSDIPGMLRKDGFNRIEVVDNKPPRYRIEACSRSGDRIRISVNPWGRRILEKKIGNCAPGSDRC